MRRAAIAVTIAVSATACIIPDRDIGFEGEFDNPGAVRIVQPTLLPVQMREICEAGPDDPLERDRTFCPQVPRTLHSGLIGLADEPFCVCPSGADNRVLPEFFVYAEDPDRASELPVDELFAVALLDFDPTESDDPRDSIAYEKQFPSDRPAELVSNRNDPGSGIFVAPSFAREDNFLWRFRFGEDGGAGTDLCNDDDGDALPPGLHNITVMVTDRPFFRPELQDADGEPILDQNGDPLLGGTQLAMPDLATGATYAVANWVFECKDPMVVGDACDCVEDE